MEVFLPTAEERDPSTNMSICNSFAEVNIGEKVKELGANLFKASYDTDLLNADRVNIANW